MKFRRGVAAAAAITAFMIAPGAPSAEPQHRQPAGPGAASSQADRVRETVGRMDRVSSQIRDLDQWMAQNPVRAEYREMNRAIEQANERVKTMAHRMDALAGDRDLRRDRARLREMDRFQDRLRVTSRELEECQAVLERVVKRNRGTGEPPEAPDRERFLERRRELTATMERLQRHVLDLNAWMVERQARKEFHETGRDMDQIREQLQIMLQDLDRLRDDAAPDHDLLREMDRFQDRIHTIAEEMIEAHESLTSLVGGP